MVVGQIGYMLVSLGTNIILARILSPYEFGQMGILMFFILIANIFTESGFGGALVRKVNATRNDFSTVFVFNLIISTLCYCLLAAFSGNIAQFYNDPGLQKLILVVGLILFINAFNITQNARLIREMRFKKKSMTLFFSNIIASIVSLFLAYRGFGVWALVAFQVLTSFFNTLWLYVSEMKFYSLRFDRNSFRELFSFGANTTLTSVIATGFDNVYQLILGRFFSISQVGYYFQAKKLQNMPFTILNSVVQSVLFSSLSKLQGDKNAFTKLYNKLFLLFATIMALLCSVMITYGNGLILILFGQKWEDSVLYFQLLSVASFYFFQELINNLIFKVFNKTQKILYLEVVKKVIQIAGIIVGLQFESISVLLLCFIITSIISYFLNLYYSRKILGGGKSEFKLVLKISLISCGVVLFFLFINDLLLLTPFQCLFTIPIFIAVFFISFKLFRVSNIYSDTLSLIKIFRNR